MKKKVCIQMFIVLASYSYSQTDIQSLSFSQKHFVEVSSRADGLIEEFTYDDAGNITRYRRHYPYLPELEAFGQAPVTWQEGITQQVTYRSTNLNLAAQSHAVAHGFRVWLSADTLVQGAPVDVMLFSTGIPALGGGQAFTGNTSMQIPPAFANISGPAWLIFETDYQQLVLERNEVNNFYRDSIFIVQCAAPPLLSVSITDPCLPASAVVTPTIQPGGAAPYTYIWSNGATTNTLSLVGNGYYTLTLVDNYGCTGSASATVTGVPTTPLSGAFALNAQHTVAYAVAAGGVTPYHYLWNNGLMMQSIPVIQGNTYTCTITDANSCTASFNTGPILRPDDTLATDVGTIHLPHGLRIYPNPTSGVLTVEAGDEGVSALVLVNLDGAVVYNEQVPFGPQSIRQINISGLPAGMYFLEVRWIDENILSEYVPVVKQ